MADEKSIFRKEAVDRISNPDDLDACLKVTSPAVWVVMLGIVGLLGGLLAWGIFGSVNTSVNLNGAKVQGSTMCFVAPEDVNKIRVGDKVYVGDVDAEVESISEVPMSEDEAREALGNDYLVDALLSGEWGYKIVFKGDLDSVKENVPVPTKIVVESVAPIMFLFSENG